jgi:hypothetical protein
VLPLGTGSRMTSTMATMGGPALDDGMEPWLQAVGLGEWGGVFRDDLGLDHIDDLGMSPRPASPCPACTHVGGWWWYIMWVEDVTEEDWPKGLAKMKYFDKRRYV